jgi:hypothetical protein
MDGWKKGKKKLKRRIWNGLLQRKQKKCDNEWMWRGGFNKWEKNWRQTDFLMLRFFRTFSLKKGLIWISNVKDSTDSKTKQTERVFFSRSIIASLDAQIENYKEIFFFKKLSLKNSLTNFNKENSRKLYRIKL